jgi:hypothetical protein
MASASQEPYEAAEEADHEHDLEEQPKKKKRINEVLDWIEVNCWDQSDKDIKVFIRAELDAVSLHHAPSWCSQRSRQRVL